MDEELVEGKKIVDEVTDAEKILIAYDKTAARKVLDGLLIPLIRKSARAILKQDVLCGTESQTIVTVARVAAIADRNSNRLLN